MGLSFHSHETRPTPFDIVWCKWPNRGTGLLPGPVARPVLVVHSCVREVDNQKVAFLVVQYGGDFEERDKPKNLHIGKDEFEALGLHKETVFRMDLGNRKLLAWCEDYFVPQTYVRNAKIVAGRLSTLQETAVLACFTQRGLTFPIPLEL